MEMLLNVYVATRDPNDKKHSLCTRSICIAVLHYDLQLRAADFRSVSRFHEYALLILTIFISHVLRYLVVRMSNGHALCIDELSRHCR